MIINSPKEDTLTSREETNTKIANSIWECRNMFRKHFDVTENGPFANLIAFVAVLAKKQGVAGDNPLEKFKNTVTSEVTNDTLREFLLEELGEFWQRATNLLISEYTEEELVQFVLTYDFTARYGKAGGDNITPDSLRELALRILDPGKDDTVADLGCGGGNFLSDVVENESYKEVYGIEFNKGLACLAIARMELLGARYEIEIGDIFTEAGSNSFDKVFTNYPFGMRITSMRGEGGYYEAMRSGSQSFGRPASADWMYNKAAYDSLREGGIAVAIMTNGAAFNGSDRQTRKYFVDNGMIRAMVALPSNLFPYASIPTTLVILGKNNGSIRMVDATDLSVPGRRRDTIGPDEIDEILTRLSRDGGSSITVTKERLSETDYNLYPARYLSRDINLENPMKLGDLALSIERGARIPARDLDELTIDEESCITYLRLSDITDGRIGNDRPRLRQIDSDTERYWLKTGDLIISKNGAPFKVAVAEVPDGDIVLANGNLYIIRLDTSIIDPYFAAAFLSSEDGKEILERYVVGTTIPSLPLKNLKNIQIPVPPMEKQRVIAGAYQSSLDEIEVLKIKLCKARVSASEAYAMAVAN